MRSVRKTLKPQSGSFLGGYIDPQMFTEFERARIAEEKAFGVNITRTSYLNKMLRRALNGKAKANK